MNTNTLYQILRGIGFDRAPPSLIDILTDLYIRHLQLLTSEAQSLASNSGREEIAVQDITQGLINIGMIKPIDLLDIFETRGRQKGTEAFLYWVVGNVPENARIASKPTAEHLTLKGKPQVLPKFMNIEGSTQQQHQEDEQTDEDWLTYVMKRSTKLGGYEEKFKNTVLSSKQNAASDVNVVGPTPEHLEQLLSYNKRKFDDIDDEL